MIINQFTIDEMVKESIKEAYSINFQSQKKKILYMSKSVSTDERFGYLQKIQEKSSNIEIIAMIPKAAKAIIDQKYNLKCICEPKEFARSFFAFDEIEISKEMMEHVKNGKYIDEFYNLREYTQVSEEGAIVLTLFAEKFLRELIYILKPDLVMFWNEFCGIHGIARKICDELDIPVSFFEFGVLPGTYAIDSIGQMGESYPATQPQKFQQLAISNMDILKAEKLRDYLFDTGLNRKEQPKNSKLELLKSKINNEYPTIFFAGQNDLDSGIYPYTEKTKRYHSPIFSSSYEAAVQLAEIAKRNNWNFIYKPHPSRAFYEKKDFPTNLIYVNDIDINEIIDLCDLTVTILSQTAYVAMIRKKPVLMLGYNQIFGKGCAYEAIEYNKIEIEITRALNNGYTQEQDKNFLCHIARLNKYYLYDDLSLKPYLVGKNIDDCVKYLNSRMNTFSKSTWINWKNDDKIAVWGAGTLGTSFIKDHYESKNIEVVIDNNISLQGEFLYGVPIVASNILNENKELKIIICCEAWYEVSQQLIKMGFKPFDDFIPLWIFDISHKIEYGTPWIKKEHLQFIKYKKKIISLMGNCQMNRIITFFDANEKFYDEYMLLRLPLIQDLSVWQRTTGPRVDIIREIDILVCQLIFNNNKFSPQWSTDSFKTLISDECNMIVIPNLFFKGYYPQAGHSKLYYNEHVTIASGKKYMGPVFPWGDKFIDRLCDSKTDVNSIIEALLDPNFLTEEEVRKNADESLCELERRENEYCDVTISDYIKDNYKKYLLFYSERHPTQLLMKEFIERILVKIGYKNKLINQPKKDDFSRNVMLIYPTVKKHLGLKFDNEFYYVIRPYFEHALTIEEYIKAYIKAMYSNEYIEDNRLTYLKFILGEIEEKQFHIYIYGYGERQEFFLHKYKFLIDEIEGFISENPRFNKLTLMNKRVVDREFILNSNGCAIIVVDPKDYEVAQQLKMNNDNILIYKVCNLFG